MEYITKPGKLTTEAQSISLKYGSRDRMSDHLFITITPNTQYLISSEAARDNPEIIRIGKSEALYNSKENNLLVVISIGDKSYQYQLFGSYNKHVPKEELIKVAESLLTQGP